MNLFHLRQVKRTKQNSSPPTTVGKRHFRVNFITFCVALLVESISLQILTQLGSQTHTPGQVASATTTSSSATGSVATPVPSATPIKSIVSNAFPVAVAAAPAQPEEVAVIFRSPLRSYRLTQYFRSGHPAIDMAATTGTPIFATAIGTVVSTGYLLQGGGLMVKISHPNGYISYYAHMSRITAKSGQQVDNQTQIGLVGSTGWATGPHLHLMLTKANGQAINPLSLIK